MKDLQDGDRIVTIDCEYMDERKRKRAKTDYVVHDSTNLEESHSRSNKMGQIIPKSVADNPAQGNMVVYKMHLGKLLTDWTSICETLGIIAYETCRRIAVDHIKRIADRGTENDSGVGSVEESLQNMASEVGSYLQCTGQPEADFLDYWKKHLNRSSALSMRGSLLSMRSSLAREMPTVRGIFDDGDDVPFLPPGIELDYREIVTKFEAERKLAFSSQKKSPASLRSSESSAQPIFAGIIFVVSESLREAAQRDRIDQMIKDHGGRVEHDIPSTKRTIRILICSPRDLESKSKTVTMSKSASIPMVKQEFISACIQAGSLLNWSEFRP